MCWKCDRSQMQVEEAENIETKIAIRKNLFFMKEN
jgi:hypothetical protein